MRDINKMIRGGCFGPKQAQLITMHSYDFQTKVVPSKGSRALGPAKRFGPSVINRPRRYDSNDKFHKSEFARMPNIDIPIYFAEL